jgi:hypothetical protein
MPTVFNTVTDAAGNPVPGAQVVIRLIATIPETTPAAGFVGTDDETIDSQIVLTTDIDGEWSTNLVPNSLITPAGTYYLVSQRPDVTPRRPAVKYRIDVPNSLGPHWAGDLLREAPDALPSAVSVASAVSFNPTGTIAATNVQQALAEVASEAGSTIADRKVARSIGRDAFTSKAMPAGSLQFTRTTDANWPLSIGTDGWVYGASDNGSAENIVRTANSFASVDTGPVFADIIQWAGRTTDGYVVITRDPFGADSSKIWFCATFNGTYQVVATTKKLFPQIGCGRPALGANGHTYLGFGEYDTNAAVRTMWVSTDGGQSFFAAITNDVETAGSNAHWHAWAYDTKMDRMWASAGDGLNAWLGYSDDAGLTWTALEDHTNGVYDQPTVLVPLAHTLATTPDAGGGTAAINLINPVTGAPIDAYYSIAAAAAASSQFGQSTFAASDDGMEAYISLAPKVGGYHHYVIATGDGGLSWQIVLDRTLTTDAWGWGIIGPDLNGKLYWHSSAGTGYLEVASTLTWERSESIPHGRPKSATTYLTIPGVTPVSVGTNAISNNTAYYERLVVDTEITIDRLVAEVTAAGAGGTKARIQIYRANKDWQPLDLVVESAEFAVDALAVNTLTIADTVLRPGRYLKRLVSSGAPTFRIIRGFTKSGHIDPAFGGSPFISIWRKALAYAAGESPGTAWDNPSASATPGEAHMIAVRIKTP